MHSKRTWMIILAAVLVLGAAQVWAIVADEFTTEKADDVDGCWHWLRATGAAATWRFAELAEGEAADKPTRCEVHMEALVTPGAGGGSGHDKHLTLELESGDFSYRFPLFLNNRAPLAMAGDEAWAEGALTPAKLTRGSDKIALKRLCRTYSETGSLRVAYAWKPTREACCKNKPEHEHHVAVNEESLWVVYPDRAR